MYLYPTHRPDANGCSSAKGARARVKERANALLKLIEAASCGDSPEEAINACGQTL